MWNDGGVDGLRPGFGAGRPSPKLEQFEELCEILDDGQLWTPQAIRVLITDCYGVTYHPAHLIRKLYWVGMNYAKAHLMDPRHPDDAEEILAERLPETFCEDNKQEEDDSVVFGFF